MHEQVAGLGLQLLDRLHVGARGSTYTAWTSPGQAALGQQLAATRSAWPVTAS